MIVVARGWHRDCGDNIVLEADLESPYETEFASTTSYKAGKVYLRKKNNGDVRITKGPTTVSLGGKYQISTLLTKAEILELFVTAYEGDSFSSVVVDLGAAFADRL
jgi:hypothetical protein